MRRFLLWYLSKKKSFRVSILSLFLSLFLVSFAIILTFTYARDYRAILILSKTIAEEMAHHLRFHFRVMSQDAEDATKMAIGFFPTIGPLTDQNPILRSYFLSKLANDPNFSNMYIGFPNGNLIGAFTVYRPEKHTFILNPTQTIPSETAYIMRSVNRQSTPPTDTWEYLNAEFIQLAKEVIPNTPFMAIDRPWYQGAVDHRGPFWTGVYSFEDGTHRAISIGTPRVDTNGDISYVIGADQSLFLLSELLGELKVGISGKALILNDEGTLVVDNTSAIITQDLVQTAYTYFQNNPSETSKLIDYKGTAFLTFASTIPNFFGAHWSVLVITPLDDFLDNLIQTQQQILVLIFVITLVAIWIIIRFSKKISQPITTLALEINKIKDLDLSSHIRVRSSIYEIFMLDQAIASMRYVVLSFAKYVPKDLVKQLFRLNKEISLGGEKKEVTIFFSDVANFTSIAESEKIDVLLPLVTEYFHAMTSIILKCEGTIDKFIGDGIMAFWGAPIATELHTQKACDAALLCHAMLSLFNQNRKKQGKPEFPTRFGIHSGEVIVGNIGTEDRMNYTVLGDAVNTTARLQEVDKVYHTSIIISEQVYDHLPSEYVARPLDLVTVKGKTKKIKIYELVGKLDPAKGLAVPLDKVELCKLFTEAYSLMEKNEIATALTKFSHIAEIFPDDFPTQIYLERLRSMQK